MEKKYTSIQFQLVRQGESKKIFFVASGNGPAPTGTIGPMSSTKGAW